LEAMVGPGSSKLSVTNYILSSSTTVTFGLSTGTLMIWFWA
jgi:hypothetical protein